MSRNDRTEIEQVPSARRFIVPVLYGIVLALGLFLLFYHLDRNLLWGDEAETGVLAKNILRYGIPKSTDGRNQISLYGGEIDSNKNGVWIWSPWLQEYIAAGSYLLFGPTTWATRAPFALVGWLCFLLLGWVVYAIYRDHWVALTSIVLLATCEVFLLHARQGRYYAVSVLGEIVFLYGVYQLLRHDKRGTWTVAAALTLQFYSNYIVAAANMPVMALLAASLYRERKESGLRAAMSVGLLLAAAAPWLIYAHPWAQSQSIGQEDVWGKAGFYLREIHFHFVPMAVALLPLVAVFAASSKKSSGAPKKKRQVKGAPGRQDQDAAASGAQVPLARFERFLLVLLATYLGVVLLTPGLYLRYLLPVLPAACVLAAAWIFRYVKSRSVAVGLILAQTATNAFAIVSAYPLRGQHTWRLPMLEYGLGIAQPYEDRFSDVLAFIRKEAQPGESLLVADPEFAMIFYTDLKVIDARFVKSLKKPYPDWFLPESTTTTGIPQKLQLPEPLKPLYEATTLQVRKTALMGCMPEPDVYEYRSAPGRTDFLVYRKKKQ